MIFLLLFFAYYPGIITYDGNNQWQQVQSGVISNAHPFFSTYFMLLLSKLHNTTSIVLLFQMICKLHNYLFLLIKYSLHNYSFFYIIYHNLFRYMFYFDNHTLIVLILEKLFFSLYLPHINYIIRK